MRQYSPLFQTLHDEEHPTKLLGRGTHYSVFRCVTWHDQFLEPLKEAAFHDFAVIWDEDHDERIISVLEDLYLKGLLAPALFVGERKGTFTLLANDSRDLGVAYTDEITNNVQSVDGDEWQVYVNGYSWHNGYIINGADDAVLAYLTELRQLWTLGMKPVKIAL